MTLFKNLFGKSTEDVKNAEVTFPWIPLTTIEQLEEIKSKSNDKAQAIFKHSTTCGISRMVLKMFTGGYNAPENSVDVYYLDLHKYREVSNETGYKFQVIHQSPQLLIIKNEAVVTHASHGAISDIKIEDYI